VNFSIYELQDGCGRSKKGKAIKPGHRVAVAEVLRDEAGRV